MQWLEQLRSAFEHNENTEPDVLDNVVFAWSSVKQNECRGGLVHAGGQEVKQKDVGRLDNKTIAGMLNGWKGALKNWRWKSGKRWAV